MNISIIYIFCTNFLVNNPGRILHVDNALVMVAALKISLSSGHQWFSQCLYHTSLPFCLSIFICGIIFIHNSPKLGKNLIDDRRQFFESFRSNLGNTINHNYGFNSISFTGFLFQEVTKEVCK